MNDKSMANQTMSRSGFHDSKSDAEQHRTIQRDNAAPKGTDGNNVGHVYENGAAKAVNGGSILWALPRKS